MVKISWSRRAKVREIESSTLAAERLAEKPRNLIEIPESFFIDSYLDLISSCWRSGERLISTGNSVLTRIRSEVFSLQFSSIWSESRWDERTWPSNSHKTPKIQFTDNIYSRNLSKTRILRKLACLLDFAILDDRNEVKIESLMFNGKIQLKLQKR